MFRHGLEPRRGDGGQVALGQLGLEAAQLLGDGFEPFLPGGDGLVDKLFPLDGVEVLDEVLVFAAPVNQGALGDTELLGDFGEADSPGTQFDELLNGLLIFHYGLSSEGIDNPSDGPVNAVHRTKHG